MPFVKLHYSIFRPVPKPRKLVKVRGGWTYDQLFAHKYFPVFKFIYVTADNQKKEVEPQFFEDNFLDKTVFAYVFKDLRLDNNSERIVIRFYGFEDFDTSKKPVGTICSFGIFEKRDDRSEFVSWQVSYSKKPKLYHRCYNSSVSGRSIDFVDLCILPPDTQVSFKSMVMGREKLDVREFRPITIS